MNDRIEDLLNEFRGLPDDPKLAFAVFCRRERERLDEFYENHPNHSGWNAERTMVDRIVGFQNVYGIDFLSEFENSPETDADYGRFFQKFSRKIDQLITMILLENARVAKDDALRTVLIIEPAHKKAIRELIDQIKEKLDTLDIADNKREALARKLNAFLNELDQDRTRIEAMLLFAVELSRTTREVDKNINPITRTVERIFGFFDKSKTPNEALPAWEERAKINAPAKQIEDASDVEDEIPF
mgnify:CR=1 FL=1